MGMGLTDVVVLFQLTLKYNTPSVPESRLSELFMQEHLTDRKK